MIPSHKNNNNNNNNLKQIRGPLEENTRIAFVLFSKFIKEVLGRIRQYKDELLCGCIELVLSLPKPFFAGYHSPFTISWLIPPIQTAFQMGLT